MKLNRISLLAALMAGALLVGSPALRAQDSKDAKEAPKREGRDFVKMRVDRMVEELKLNDDQKTKLTELFKSQTDKMRELRSATPDERREKAKTMREEMDKKMKEILTSEQYEKWTKNRPQLRPGGPGGEQRKKKTE